MKSFLINIPVLLLTFAIAVGQDPTGEPPFECRLDETQVKHEWLLRTAITANDESCVRRLLADRRIRPDGQYDDIEGSEPIQIASVSNVSRGIVDVLFEAGLDPNSAEVRKAFFRVCLTGQSELVERFLVAKVPVETKGTRGETALMYATASGDPRTVELLLKKQADPNARSDRGVTPMMTAAENTAVLDILKKYGARIDESDNRGWTALFIAIIKEQVDKAEWLLRNGADPNTRNLEGNTALRFLRKLENTEKRRTIAEMLKRYGGKP